MGRPPNRPARGALAYAERSQGYGRETTGSPIRRGAHKQRARLPTLRLPLRYVLSREASWGCIRHSVARYGCGGTAKKKPSLALTRGGTASRRDKYGEGARPDRPPQALLESVILVYEGVTLLG